MKWSSLHYIIFCIFISNVLSEKQVNVKIKKIKCEHDPTIYNTSMLCKIKPTRNGDGNTTILFNFHEPANDFWAQMKFYYKFGTIYRPFMVDLDVNICEYFKNPFALPLFYQIMKKVLNEEFPNILHPCPYYGEVGVRHINLNKIVSRAVPQVVPKGYYKVVNRYHLSDNRTFLTLTVEVYVDAIDPMKSYDMG
uniref:CSON004130 protein n=1 Tax=Culicoides sonorensis TaxID=179676 RepID=A0A336L4M4_CULSO